MPVIRTNPDRLPSATMNLYSSGSMVQLPTVPTDIFQVIDWIKTTQARLKQLGVWTE